jgi:FkbM family methyltransferase
MATALDLSVLQRFQLWAGTVPPGFFADIMGNLVRVGFWSGWDEKLTEWSVERFEDHRVPGPTDALVDWLCLLEAVDAAQGRFVTCDLGAGFGHWLVAANVACKQKGLEPQLIGIEAESQHFAWMLDHFRDNGIDPSVHRLIKGAVSGEKGTGYFYVDGPGMPKGPAAWYGQALATGAPLPGWTTIPVPTITLDELLDGYTLVDYLQMDIQGAEYDVLSACPDVLRQRVKRVLIGTHSHEIEDNLRELFLGLGWHAKYDIPMGGIVGVGEAEFTMGDGAQYWLNPALT